MPRIFVSCLAAALAAAPAAAQQGSLADFAFLAGDWVTTTPAGAHMEMRVLEPRAGTISGFMRLSRDDQFWIQEYFVLTEKDGVLEMRVQPFDRLLAPGQLIVLQFRGWEGNRARFENPVNDQPKWAWLTRHADGTWTNRSEIIQADGTSHIIENTLRRPGG